MKNLILLSTFFILANQLPAQMRGGTEYLDNYAKLMTKKAKGPSLEGSIYVIDDHHQIEVKLIDGFAKLDQARLNLQNSNIDVLVKGEEMEILYKDYDHVTFIIKGMERVYMPAPKYKFEGKPLTGFVEILGTGEEKVLINHSNYLRKANNDSRIIGGAQNDRLIRKWNTYILKGKKITEVDGKKDVLKYYKNKSKQAEKLIKENHLDVKDPDQLSTLLQLMSDGAEQ